MRGKIIVGKGMRGPRKLVAVAHKAGGGRRRGTGAHETKHDDEHGWSMCSKGSWHACASHITSDRLNTSAAEVYGWVFRNTSGAIHRKCCMMSANQAVDRERKREREREREREGEGERDREVEPD